MSVSVRLRFEVFKRDRFTCSYCGGHPPDVLLEVDHVIPRAAGGNDEMTNLVTACWDCNRGKSDRLLDEAGHPVVGKRTIQAVEERLEQARAYVALLGELSTVTEAMIGRVTDAWARGFGAEAVERDDGSFWVFPHNGMDWPNYATIRVFLRDLSLDEVLRAIDMSASKFGETGWKKGADKYFYAICWRMIREKQSARSGPVEDDRLASLYTENQRLSDELADALEVIEDLRLNIRRLRDEAGRE